MSEINNTFGLIGFGTVGRATTSFIRRNFPAARVYVDDLNKAMVAHVNKNLPRLSLAKGLAALFVCVNLPDDVLTDADLSAAYLHDAIVNSWFYKDVGLTGVPICVRTTVPVGTCDELKIRLGTGTPVFYQPEFQTEVVMRSQPWKTFTPLLGMSLESLTADNECAGASDALRRYFSRSWSEAWHPFREVEFLKVAYNMKRATEVHLHNELMRSLMSTCRVDSRGAKGILCDLPESDSPPTYHTWMFGGECLDNSLRMMDVHEACRLSRAVKYGNSAKAREFGDFLISSRCYYNMESPTPVVAVVGCQNGPGSGRSANGPAFKWLKQQQVTKEFCLLDTTDVVKRLTQELSAVPLMYCKPEYATPSDCNSRVDTIVIAQHTGRNHEVSSHYFMRALRESEAPVKLVYNPAGAYFSDSLIETATKWGAVFVDNEEITRFVQEEISAREDWDVKPT